METHIPERIADFVDAGTFKCELIYVESEHSAISAAIGSSATGVRTYTATASQGLALMHEILHVVSGMRLPIVMNVANRALSAPINIWNDHQDSMNARDTSWIQIYVESAQEALDSTIQAFRIAEDKKVQLPIMICLDGFTLTHVYEPVDIPSQKEVSKYLPKFKPQISLDGKPLTLGPIGYPEDFMGFKLQQHEAMLASKQIIKKANTEFNKTFKRSYGDGLLEPYKLKDAEIVFLGSGTICGTARVVIDKLRKQGIKAGMCKVRTFRPFPEEEIIKSCGKAKSLVVFDRAVSFGHKGPLFSEIQAAFTTQKTKPQGNPIIHSYIAGLGGYDVTLDHFENAFKEAKNSKTPISKWLYKQ